MVMSPNWKRFIVTPPLLHRRSDQSSSSKRRTAMEQRISLITLGVADLARSRAFYEALGWTRSVKAAEGVAFFQIGGLALALWPLTELAADARLSPARSGFAGMALAYNAR